MLTQGHKQALYKGKGSPTDPGMDMGIEIHTELDSGWDSGLGMDTSKTWT